MIGLSVEELDIYQFVDSTFVINAQLIDLSSNLVHKGETSFVKVLLAFEGNASAECRCKEHHPNLIEVVHNTGIQPDGKAQIWVKLKDVSANHADQRFVIYLETYRPVGENNIIAAITNPFSSVRYKLMISETNISPFIWYKDEGAKDKCIRVLVKLVDADKNIVKSRAVALTASLIYSSGQAVAPESVLSVFLDKDHSLAISAASGTETIRFRVNEVSRNHRKQMFHLLVTPLDAADIAAATSIPFEVKSKRTSDARQDSAEDAMHFAKRPNTAHPHQQQLQQQIPHQQQQLQQPFHQQQQQELLLPQQAQAVYALPCKALTAVSSWAAMAANALDQHHDKQLLDAFHDSVAPALTSLQHFLNLQGEATAQQQRLLSMMLTQQTSFVQQISSSAGNGTGTGIARWPSMDYSESSDNMSSRARRGHK